MENIKEYENTELGGVHLWSGVAIFWRANIRFNGPAGLTAVWATYLSWETAWSPGTATTPHEGARRSFSCTRADPTHTNRSCNVSLSNYWQAGRLGLLLVSWLHWELGVVSHHAVGLVAGLVVLVDHPVLLSSSSPLVIRLREGARLPEVIPRGGAAQLERWNNLYFLFPSHLPIPLLAMLVRLTCLARTLVEVTRVFMSTQLSANN